MMGIPNSGSLVYLFCARVNGMMLTRFQPDEATRACLGVFVPTLDLEVITQALRTFCVATPMMASATGNAGDGVMCWWPELSVEDQHVLLPDHWSVADLWLNEVHGKKSNGYSVSAAARLEPIFEMCLQADLKYAGAPLEKKAGSGMGDTLRYEDDAVDSLWYGFLMAATYTLARANELARGLEPNAPADKVWYLTKYGWLNLSVKDSQKQTE